jgi:hypothetical protein
LKLYAIGILLTSTSFLVSAHDAYKVVPVSNGINRLILDGQDAMAVRGWRENFNAHGFDVTSIFIQDGVADHAGSWNIVPLFGRQSSAHHEDLHVIATGGADCQLHDFRLLTTEDGKHAQLILAARDLGTSYAAAATVRFDFYVLTENTDGIPGYPKHYFLWQRSERSHSQYCDVNEAFDRELHLDTSGGAGHPGDVH